MIPFQISFVVLETDYENKQDHRNTMWRTLSEEGERKRNKDGVTYDNGDNIIVYLWCIIFAVSLAAFRIT